MVVDRPGGAYYSGIIIMADRQRLEELASLYGVEAAYYDALGNHRVGSDEAILSTLRALGADVGGHADVPGAIVARRRASWEQLTKEVAVAWGAAAPALAINTPRGATGTVRAELTTEAGETRSFDYALASLPALGGASVDGQDYEVRRLDLGPPLPPGYHRVRVSAEDQTGARTVEVTLIAAPERAPMPPVERSWGAFLPLYALHSEQSLGAGNATDLLGLIEFISELGGQMLGTLPLLATFLDEPFEYSPYAPVTRLFWNELFVDPRACRELDQSPGARALLDSQSFVAEAAALRAEPLVDYRRQYALLAPVIEALAETFFDGDTAELVAFEEAHPRVRDYARFRAAVDRYGAPTKFPQRLRDGTITDEDVDLGRVRYHLYAQLRTTEQIERACAEARKLGIGLYLDMPLGVHADGYDAYREADSLLTGLSAGAPPDPLFTGGQKWGFAPLSPDGMRRSGYRYLRECLALQMRGAGVLRIDHVMGLHRLYCIPEEMSATEGVYVGMPHEELYAVVVLEAHRHGTCLVGEDLGTVPDEVRAAMDKRALHRMYVLPFELRPNEPMIMGDIPVASVASANTHDLPTFQGWWSGADIDVRREMGLLTDDAWAAEHRDRDGLTAVLADRLGTPHDAAAVLGASLTALAGSDARFLLINLEDLWLEEAPQNVPGTHRERPNWRRKAGLTLEAMREDPRVVDLLKRVHERRTRS
ncbi:MAG: 4-alpha-glucanotransferase [Deltaproteobacteria bacterium]|nr:MAG: 4-alpha-glucanotransferase [Deltaproteobacteria bacterium]